MKNLIKIFNPEKLSSLIFYLSIFTFIIAFNFSDNPPAGGWYQQFMPPSLPGITDITFTDSLTGYAVTAAGSGSYIIKTTNGGDNWNINFQDNQSREFTKIKFINGSIGFACTKWGSGSSKLYKTTNSGDNWFTLNNPTSGFSYLDLSVLNENELWTADDIAFDGGVFKTTNGGMNWQRMYYDISRPSDRVYMVNSRIGFISNGALSNGFLRKTTDSGNSWFLLNDYGFYKMQFEDSLIGYKSDENLKMTIDGGFIWDTILAVQNGNPPHGIRDFAILNNTIWGVHPDANILFPNLQFRGVIFKTTNSGTNWGYQLPDTTIKAIYYFTDFVNSDNGWCWKNRVNGVHTMDGGDSITYILTSINSSNLIIPKQFQLFQNHPNPFNPRTKIEYELQTSDFVSIKIYDLLGKEIKSYVNKKQTAGKYQIDFDGSGLSGGVYFYSLYLNNNLTDTKKMLMVK
ncbi:MAG: T9SS type A sorting domain-containing protein [Ignavibacteria bacterium]|nr:T9SS type A sorting domain-containing protein [Ignavibacteria bacterium]